MEEESETDISKLRSWCFENISKEKVPEKWFLLDEIPKNDRGKVNRFDVSKACIQ
jgi:acyl-coenzyme A synthetase/AMP-(fatty) acid ligase